MRPRGFNSGFSQAFGAGRFFYGLSQYVWDTSQGGFWRQPSAVIAAVDLRSIPNQSAIGGTPQGFAFVASMQPVDVPIARALHFADENVTSLMQDAWESELGYRPQGAKVVDLLADMLLNGADPTGDDAVKPLQPTIGGMLEIVLPYHSVVWEQEFRFGVHTHTNKLKALLQIDLERIRAESEAGRMIRPIVERGKVVGHEKDHAFHRRVMQRLCEKYRCSFEDLRPANWPKSDRPLPHNTTITESFNKADSDTLGPDLTWNEVSGDWDVASNEVSCPGSGSLWARAESDLSSADHTSQVDMTAVTASGSQHFGPAARFASAASTFYSAPHAPEFNLHRTFKYVSGSLTVIGSDSSDADTQPDTLKIECNGSTIKRYFNGSQTNSVTDTAITGNLRCGLYAIAAGVSCKGDNFQAADITLGTVWVATENFNSYSDPSNIDTLSGGTNWNGNWVWNGTGTQPIVTAAPAGGEGGKALKLTSTTNGTRAYRLINPLSAGICSFRVNITNTSPNDFCGVMLGSAILTYKIYLKIESGNLKVFNGGSASYDTIQAVSADTWYTIDLEFDDTAQPDKFRVRVDGGTWSAWTSANGTFYSINSLTVDKSSTNALTFWVDDIKAGTATTTNRRRRVLLGAA